MWILSMLTASAVAAPVTVPSAHGALAVDHTGDRCSVTLRSAKHGSVSLLTLDNCVGASSLEPVQRVGTLLFPAVAGATEFHIFTILSARGGNACDGYEAYVIALDGANAWASDAFGGCAGLESAAVRPDGTLIVDTRSSDGAGQRATVRMGKATFTALAARGARGGSAAAAGTETVRGVLEPAIHATNFHDYVETAPGGWSPVEITDPGTCALDALYGQRVEMVLRVKGEQRTCLSVKPDAVR
jgi:hypothetical protein